MSLRISPDVRWRTIDGEVVIVSQRAGEVMGLNESASRFIDLVASGAGWDEIVATMAQEFDAERDVIAGELAPLARELLALGVLDGTLPEVARGSP